MTGRDLFPFGKWKGKTLQWVKDNEPSYINWLRDQDWAEEKWADLLDWFDCGDAIADREEVKIINVEMGLLKDAPPGFRVWWQTAYGERLRKDGSQLYIGYLRVSLEAWNAGVKCQTDLLKGIPAPTTTKEVFDKTETAGTGCYSPRFQDPKPQPKDNRDETVNF